MPPPPIVDFTRIDMEAVRFRREEILEVIPHRFEIVQLDWIVALEPEEQYSVGIKEVREDEFWVKGHIPGRPILPGVLIIEAAAQLFSYYVMTHVEHEGFLGFGGTRVSDKEKEALNELENLLRLSAPPL